MGRKADFRNTIVLITSNLGARFLAGQSAPLGFAAGSEAVFEKQAAQAVEEAKKWFRPELVGRLDELIVFRPLSDESMSAIAEKMLCRLEVRAARSGYQLRHTPQVGAVAGGRARSAYGARELRRQVDRAVEQALADQIAAGTACTGRTGLRTVRQRAPSSSGRTRRRPFDTGQGMTKMPCILQNFCYHRSNRIAGGTTCTPCFF